MASTGGGGDRDPVGKALAVLLALVDEPDDAWSVRGLARGMSTSPATVHRIFTALERRGMLRQVDDGTYRPGPELFRLTARLRDGYAPVRLARPHIEALACESGEGVLLGAYEPARRQMMFVDVVQAVYPLQYEIALHQWIPVHAGATGLAILAWLSEGDRAAVYESGLTRITGDTIVDVPGLESECARARDRGYAVSVAQRLMGAAAVAAPVFDVTGAVLGDISVTLPQQRFESERHELLARRVVAAAAAVTEELRHARYRRG